MASPPSTVSNSSHYSDGSTHIVRAENELRGAVDAHITHLEQLISSRDQTIQAMKIHMENTMQDFKVNEQLIIDRDADIDELSRLTERLQREKTTLGEQLNTERAVSSDASRRVNELSTQLQNLRVLHEESLADHQVALDRMRAGYEEQLRTAREKFLNDKDHDTKIHVSKIHESEDARVQHIREVEAAAEQKVKFAQQRTEVVEDQLKIHEGTIANLREEIKNIRAECQRREMELYQWQNNTQELQQSFDYVKAEQNQEVELLGNRLRDLEKIHQAKLADTRDAQQRSVLEATELRHQIQRLELDLQNSVVEREELQKRDTVTAETYKMEVKKIESQYDKVKEEMDRRLKELLSANTQQATDLKKLQLHDEEQADEISKLKIRLEEEEGKVVNLKREVSDRCETQERLQREVHEAEKKIRTATQTATKAEESLRLSTQTANDTIEDLRGQIDHLKTQSERQAHTLEAEIARLKQELSSSEAIRLEVEDQLQRAMNSNGVRDLVKLQEDKKNLQQQVHSLEIANEAIRKQVQHFTEEMQNDPILKGAKEATQKAAELEIQLKDSKLEMEAMRERINQQDRELRSFENERQQLQRETQRLYNNEKSDVAELKRQLRDKQSTIDALTSGVEGESAAKVSMARAINARVEHLEDRVAELCDERDQLERKNGSLAKQVRDLEAFNNAQHAELLALSRSHQQAASLAANAAASRSSSGMPQQPAASVPIAAPTQPEEKPPTSPAATDAPLTSHEQYIAEVRARARQSSIAAGTASPSPSPLPSPTMMNPTTASQVLQGTAIRPQQRSSPSATETESMRRDQQQASELVKTIESLVRKAHGGAAAVPSVTDVAAPLSARSRCDTCRTTVSMAQSSGRGGSIYSVAARTNSAARVGSTRPSSSSGARVIRRGESAVRNYAFQ